jgi:hypothetical protein
MSRPFESIDTGVAAPGLRPDGTLPKDFTEEATQAWRDVAEALSRAGARLSDARGGPGAGLARYPGGSRSHRDPQAGDVIACTHPISILREANQGRHG